MRRTGRRPSAVVQDALLDVLAYPAALRLDLERAQRCVRDTAVRRSDVSVDPRYGRWNPRQSACARADRLRHAPRRAARTVAVPGRVVVVGPRTGRGRSPPAGARARARARRRIGSPAPRAIPRSTSSRPTGVTFESFDDVYDAAPDLDSAYAEIAARARRRRGRARRGRVRGAGQPRGRRAHGRAAARPTDVDARARSRACRSPISRGCASASTRWTATRASSTARRHRRGRARGPAARSRSATTRSCSPT